MALTVHTMIKILILVLFTFFVSSVAISKPMDTNIANEYLPKVLNVVAKLKANIELSDEDKTTLSYTLSSGHPVIVALSAWSVGHTNDSKLFKQIAEILPMQQDFASAYIRIALAKRGLDEKDIDAMRQSLLDLSYEKNIFLKLEAAKELLNVDMDLGMVRLRELSSGNYTKITPYVVELLRQQGDNIEPLALPLGGNDYGFVVKLMVNTKPFNDIDKTKNSSPMEVELANKIQEKPIIVDTGNHDRTELPPKLKSTDQLGDEFVNVGKQNNHYGKVVFIVLIMLVLISIWYLRSNKRK